MCMSLAYFVLIKREHTKEIFLFSNALLTTLVLEHKCPAVNGGELGVQELRNSNMLCA